MKLNKYDGKCVRIAAEWGEVFEGVCAYNNEEYTEHEFGYNEDCLQLPNFLLFKDEIRDIEVIEEGTEEYSEFLNSFGLCEENALEGGIDEIEDLLCDECEITALRMLNCLEQNLDKLSDEEIRSLLSKAVMITDSQVIRNKTEHIINLLGK